MASTFIDIHPHIIASDEARYPRAPVFGVQSDWSRERPVEIDGLIAAMDKAGVQKAAIVQASTCYNFDNSFLTDSIARYPGRFTAVGSVDLAAPDATKTIRDWMKRGVTGLRLFTGGSTTSSFDTRGLDDPRVFPAWELCAQDGLSMCLQTGFVGLAQIAGMAKRFPTVKIILDHLARPDLSDGPPYLKALPLFGLAPFENIYLKVTPRIFEQVEDGKATPESFFGKLLSAFGAKRVAWGSNFPATAGSMADNLATATRVLACVSDEDRNWIFAKTAQTLYPALADT